jgi:DNA polymerase I-like protein with 3'-5' exonuclease and polymerase domains
LVPPARKLLKQATEAGATFSMLGDDLFVDGLQDQRLSEQLQTSGIYDLLVPKIDQNQRDQAHRLLNGTPVEYITNNDRAAEMVREQIAVAQESGILALDTETAVKEQYRQPIPIKINKDGSVAKRQPKDGAAGYALSPRHAYVRLVQVFAGETIALFDMHHVDSEILRPLVTDVPMLGMFNAVFDVKHLIASCDLEPTVRIWDSQIGMRLVRGYRSQWPIGMDTAADHLLGVDVPKGLGASHWFVKKLSQDQRDYAAIDPLITYDLVQEQREVFDDADNSVQSITDECIVAVARMELAGMHIDVDAHRDFITTWEQELEDAENALRAITGGRLYQDPTPAQIRDYLEDTLTPEQRAIWPTTKKTGELQASKNAYRLAGADVPGVAELEMVSLWRKGLSTYGESLLERVEPNGRLYGRFLLAGARTGRFSSREPNLQNIPKRSKAFSKFRQVFAAPPGYVMMAADYSQIELRIMAEIAEDQTMLETYDLYDQYRHDPVQQKRYDVHRTTAASLSEDDLDTLPAETVDLLRTQAKAANFGLIYGSGARGFMIYAKVQYGLDMTLDEAEDIIYRFRETYLDIAAWQDRQTGRARTQGHVMTVGGRTWHFDWGAHSWDDPKIDELEDWQVDDFVAGFERNFALNLPVQGSAAEVMQLALAHVDKALRPYNARIVATVHDELVLEVKDYPATIRSVRRVLRTKMTRALLELFPDAACMAAVDIGVGPTWAEAH